VPEEILFAGLKSYVAAEVLSVAPAGDEGTRPMHLRDHRDGSIRPICSMAPNDDARRITRENPELREEMAL
jgi:hypothetical protein